MGRRFLCKLPLFYLLLAGIFCHAQSRFAYKTALGPVPANGFYTIPLPPRLVASCSTLNLADLRIADEAGTTVPYILQTDLPAVAAGSFSPYPILSNAKKDSSTELVISNEQHSPIRSLLFIIKNASAYRTAILSGSDDQKNWFVIDENIELEQTGTQQGDRFVQAIFFPLSNYRYFKLIIRDKGLLPLNILQAGVNKNSAYAGKYLAVPVRSIRQTDSTDRSSYVHIYFDHPYKLDKLQLHIKRPALYKRSMQVFEQAQGMYTPLQDGELSPAGRTILMQAKTGEVLVKIFNGDNPPLLVDSVAAYQVNQQLVVQLEKDKSYTILTGNASVGKPDYDLRFFKDSIASGLPEIGIGPVVKNALPAPVQTNTGNSKLILWIIIGIVLLILLVLTLKMSKEVGNRGQAGGRNEQT